MKQHSLKPAAGSTKARKRVGRGGQYRTYSGRGMKGQNARTGGGVRPGFEGGQTPLLRRMPKLKGFKNPNRVDYFPLNVAMLDTFKDGSKVDAEMLVEMGVIKAGTPVKLLGNGDLSKKITIAVDKASESAIKKVEKAGGKVTVLMADTKPAKEESAKTEESDA